MSTKHSRIGGLLLLAAGFMGAVAAELTSSDVKLVALRGDTACLITARGINWTTSLSGTPVTWGGMTAEGYGYAAAYDAAIGPQGALFCMAGEGMVNGLVFVSFGTNTTRAQATGFAEDITKPWLDLRAGCAVRGDSGYWIGCGNAGLMYYSDRVSRAAVFVPGTAGVSYGLDGTLPYADLDSATAVGTRIIDCSKGPRRIALARPDGLWLFDPADTSWEHTVPPGTGVIYDVESSPDDDSLHYAITVDSSGSSDTSLYAWDHGVWRLCVEEIPSALATAPARSLYVADAGSQDLSHALDTGLSTPTLTGSSSYKKRILAGGGADYRISDVAYSPFGTDAVLVVATDDGIFFTVTEHADTAGTVALRHETLPVAAGAGLAEVHATPSILSGENEEPCRFVYNLASDARVTIDIFDYNMDHVTRIIDNVHKSAGTYGAKGFAEVWDGKAGGRMVAPGVYYFVIRTDAGTRGYGKIIVARR